MTLTYDVEPWRRLHADTRYALAAALLDDARNSWEKAHRQVRKRLHRGVTSLRELAETVLAWRTAPEAPLSTLLDHIDPHRIAGAVEDCVTFERLERHGLLDTLHGKYANFRRYFRFFVDLPFAAAAGSEALVHNLEIVRQLNREDLKACHPRATPPWSRSPGATVCRQASRAGGAPGRFPSPSVSQMRSAVAMCFCLTLGGLSRFGIWVMTSLPGKSCGSPYSTSWDSQPMA